MACKKEGDPYFSKDATRLRGAQAEIKHLIAEFGDPNDPNAGGYRSPYAELESATVVFEQRKPNQRVSTFPTFMPEVERRVAR